MEDKVLVSIIINNYNYGHFLRKAIDSALGQTYKYIEVIVVDDGSTDNSREIIASYGDSIIPIMKGNGGQASAFNSGFALSGGDIICFLDSDDYFASDKVMRIVEAFGNYPNVRWVFHGLEYVDKDGLPLSLKVNGSWYEIGSVDVRKALIRGEKLKCARPATSALCFKRTLLNDILPVPEAIRITSDEYLKHAALYASPGIYSVDKLAYQRIHGSNAYSFRAGVETLRSETELKTMFYLRERFSEMAAFTDKRFATSFGSLIGRIGLKGALKNYEARKYIEYYFPIQKYVVFAPRITFNVFKAILKKINDT